MAAGNLGSPAALLELPIGHFKHLLIGWSGDVPALPANESFDALLLYHETTVEGSSNLRAIGAGKQEQTNNSNSRLNGLLPTS